MTYCIGLNLEHGLILASDSRTNAGVDDIRRTGKMRLFVSEGEYVVAALSAGNGFDRQWRAGSKGWAEAREPVGDAEVRATLG